METSREFKSLYENKEIIEWGGLLNEILWICAGANRKVLRQCPTEYAKYAGIGGTILFTALMAMLSGGYALYTVFNDQLTAIGFGVFWGLLIFNLDRFIVNTMYSDGKVTISWQEFYSGLPRIIMAIFLGVVISTPLELKIYESEIDVRIGEDAKKKIDEYRHADQHRIDSLNNVIAEMREKADNLPQVISLTGQAGQLQSELANKQNALNALKASIASLQKQRSIFDEKSQRYAQLTNQINAKVSQRITLNSQVRQLQGQLGSVSKEYSDAIKNSENQKSELVKSIQSQIEIAKDNLKSSDEYKKLIHDEYGGFEARMKAFHEMREENPSTDLSAWCIMLLFIIIETAPTFFKMMIASGPYDDLLRAEMHRVRIMSDKRISDINDNINTEVQISTEKNKQRLEAEVLANKELMERLAKTQAELLKTAIDKWREEELAKINENPSAYIQTTNRS
jgi:hypothetical protein